MNETDKTNLNLSRITTLQIKHLQNIYEQSFARVNEARYISLTCYWITAQIYIYVYISILNEVVAKLSCSVFIRNTNKIKVVSLIKIFMIVIVMGYRLQLSPI